MCGCHGWNRQNQRWPLAALSAPHRRCHVWQQASPKRLAQHRIERHPRKGVSVRVRASACRRRHCRHLSAATKVAGEAARRRRSLRTPAACRPPGRRQGPLVEQQEARRRTPSRHRHERDNAPTPREPASAALRANGSPTQSDRRRGGGATTLRGPSGGCAGRRWLPAGESAPHEPRGDSPKLRQN